MYIVLMYKIVTWLDQHESKLVLKEIWCDFNFVFIKRVHSHVATAS